MRRRWRLGEWKKKNLKTCGGTITDAEEQEKVLGATGKCETLPFNLIYLCRKVLGSSWPSLSFYFAVSCA